MSGKAKTEEVEPQEVLDRRHAEHHGPSGGHMGAGKSGKENLGPEKPADDTRWGSSKPENHPGDSTDQDDTEGNDNS